MSSLPDREPFRVWNDCVRPTLRSLRDLMWSMLWFWFFVCLFFSLHPLTGHRLAISDPAPSKAILQAQPPAEVAPVAAQAL